MGHEETGEEACQVICGVDRHNATSLGCEVYEAAM
jgi:hypothetical protein